MKEYTICIPFKAVAVITIEAETKKDATEEALATLEGEDFAMFEFEGIDIDLPGVKTRKKES